jgi:hypothetical protein
MTRIRGNKGKFIQRSDESRLVRSIRATDSVWDALGRIADGQCITRADLIEYLALNHVLHEDVEKENQQLKKEIEALNSEILKLKKQSSTEVPQQLDIFMGAEQIKLDKIHFIKDKVLGMNILKIGKQSKTYQQVLKLFDKFIEILFDEFR